MRIRTASLRDHPNAHTENAHVRAHTRKTRKTRTQEIQLEEDKESLSVQINFLISLSLIANIILFSCKVASLAHTHAHIHSIHSRT